MQHRRIISILNRVSFIILEITSPSDITMVDAKKDEPTVDSDDKQHEQGKQTTESDNNKTNDKEKGRFLITFVKDILTFCHLNVLYFSYSRGVSIDLIYNNSYFSFIQYDFQQLYTPVGFI